MRILGIDPGVMSGVCYGELDEDTNVLTVNPTQVTDDVDDMFRRLKAFAPRYIAIEDFEFRQKSRTGLNLFPVQLIGVVRLYALTQGQCVEKLQKASEGKAYYTDPILKSKGLYVRGLEHGVDAMRHLLHWFTFGPGYQFNKNTEIKLAEKN